MTTAPDPWAILGVQAVEEEEAVHRRRGPDSCGLLAVWAAEKEVEEQAVRRKRGAKSSGIPKAPPR